MSTEANGGSAALSEARDEAVPALAETAPEVAPEVASGPLLTLAEAARTVGLSERALRKHIQRGRLVPRTLVRNGRTIAAVDLATLKRTYGSLVMVPTATVEVDGEGGARGTRLRSRVELDQLKKLKELIGARRDLEGRLAKLKALLGMERTQKREMQRQLQHMADSLARGETRLEAAHAASRELVLELGIARGRTEELTRRLEPLEAVERVEAAPSVRPVEALPADAALTRSTFQPVESRTSPLSPSRGGFRT